MEILPLGVEETHAPGEGNTFLPNPYPLTRAFGRVLHEGKRKEGWRMESVEIGRNYE
jgi:hypothetical protein